MKYINNKLNIFSVVVGFLLLSASCTKDFEQINEPPNSVTSINPDFVFAQALREAAYPGPGFPYWKVHIQMYGCWMQHWGNHIPGFSPPYYSANPVYDNGYWDENYLTMKNLAKVRRDLLDENREDPESRSKIGMTLIQEIMMYDKMTAALGDIPYTEAVTTESEQNTTPKYDPQQEIYNDPETGLVARIDEAKSLLNSGDITFGNSDMYYEGDIDSWRRLANTLKLRMGMRMTKTDESRAEQIVTEAMGTDLLEAPEHTAAVPTAGGNPRTFETHHLIELKRRSQGQLQYAGEHFINVLKAKDDPRIDLLWDYTVNSQRAADDAVDGPGIDSTLLDYQGIPPAKTQEQYDALERDDYSFPSEDYMLNEELGRPMPIFTLSEALFLKAEAALRGWGANPADAEGYFQEAIRAELERLQSIDPNGIITDQEIDDFVAAEGDLDEGGFEANLEKLMTHKWMALFERNLEAFLNWRRTGYPQLSTGTAQGETNGQIPRRGKYSTSERSLNKENYNEAVDRMGGDAYMTKMWLDTP